MSIHAYSFIHLVFLGFIALFPVVNPLGTAFIVSPYFSALPVKERFRAIKKITVYAFGICAFTLFTGHWILEMFGISIPVVQLAGGIMICKIGWDFLTPGTRGGTSDSLREKTAAHQSVDIDDKLFYPITFPITTGAGTISVLLTLSAHGATSDFSQYLQNTAAIIISVIGICILIFVCYVNANRLISYMGSRNEKIVNSIMAFLIFCVGLQIAVEGITQLVK